MSVYDGKANYHPVSNLAGNVPNGSWTLPGNGYYSVTGAAPKLGTDHNSCINNPKYKHSQSYRIDPLHSLMKLKEESSLTRYYHHDPPVETVRDRYIFVPKSQPRDEPAEVPNQSLRQFQHTMQDTSKYQLNRLEKLPDVDYHVIADEGLDNDAFRLYGAKNSYDMMVLRDQTRYNINQTEPFHSKSSYFISSSTIPR